MKLRRFRLERSLLNGREALIRDRAEIRHIRKVLRLRVGDQVLLFDGEGGEYRAAITTFGPQEICLALAAEPAPRAIESPLSILLGLALLKSSKFDWLIQKATELGVSEVVPFHSLHVVPRWAESAGHSRHDRWQKIAGEAAKQCGRATVPRIHPACSFAASLKMGKEQTAKIFLWEKEETARLKDVLPDPVSEVYVLVGPEGGFSNAEARQAAEAGFRPLRLGPRILRAETAGLVIVGLLQYLLGDLG